MIVWPACASHVIDSEFGFQETVTVGGSAVTRAGKDSRSDLLPGGYLDAQVSWRWKERASFFAGGQDQYLSRFSERAAGQEAELDFDKALFIAAGVRFSF